MDIPALQASSKEKQKTDFILASFKGAEVYLKLTSSLNWE
jgi:hypothetical protein